MLGFLFFQFHSFLCLFLSSELLLSRDIPTPLFSSLSQYSHIKWALWRERNHLIYSKPDIIYFLHDVQVLVLSKKNSSLKFQVSSIQPLEELETFKSPSSIISQTWLQTLITWGALKLLMPAIHLQRSSLNWSGV